MRSIRFRTNRDKTFVLNDLGWTIEMVDQDNPYIHGNVTGIVFDDQDNAYVEIDDAKFRVISEDAHNVEIFFTAFYENIEKIRRLGRGNCRGRH